MTTTKTSLCPRRREAAANRELAVVFPSTVTIEPSAVAGKAHRCVTAETGRSPLMPERSRDRKKARDKPVLVEYRSGMQGRLAHGIPMIPDGSPAVLLRIGGNRFMGRLHELQAELFQDGKITGDEVAVIRQYLGDEGDLDLEDVKFLVELLCTAREVSPAFDEIFFPALKKVILADGRVGLDEQFYLLKMLYSDGNVRESEREFLRNLRREAKEITPEFEALCEEAFRAPATDWSVGGK